MSAILDATSLRKARLTPPLSKSDAHRALALAHARGLHVSFAEDDVASDGGAQQSGRGEDDGALPADVVVMRRGLAILRDRAGEGDVIDVADAGAPFRILVGQAAVTPGAHVRFTGTPRLAQRPHDALLTSLRAAFGDDVVAWTPLPSGPLDEVLTDGDDDARHGWPLVVRAPAAPAALRFTIDARESSQFATSLLLAAATACVRDGRPGSVALTGAVASEGYLDLTRAWLTRCGFLLHVQDGVLTVAPGTAPAVIPSVPGDWSSAGYLLLVAWRTGGDVARVDLAAEHPDRAIIDVLSSIGVALQPGADGAVSVVGAARGGVRASGAACPDLLPTLAALACVLPAPSVLTEVSILRQKESDRLQGIVELVAQGGGTTSLTDDALTITPGVVPVELAMRVRGDHRLAMAAAVLAVLAGRRIELDDAACVAKSFPGFWRELGKSGAVLRHTRPGTR